MREDEIHLGRRERREKKICGGKASRREGGREGEEGERAREGRRMSGSKKDTFTRRAREGRCVERKEQL